MIRSIELINFQSHEHTTIDFCDGVNAIVGLSDSGKTAILRAINWVVNNKPTGDAFQSSWGGDTTVTLTLDDGAMIVRGRTKSDNYYKMGDQEFRAFGAGKVPVEIETVLNLNHINIQAQMDGPFLLGSSPGEVAQILNKVVNLDVIDKAISSIRKDKLKADGDLRNEESRLDDLTEQLREYDYLPVMQSAVFEVEELAKELQGHQRAKKELVSLQEGVKSAVSRVEQAEKVIGWDLLVLQASELVEHRADLQDRYVVLMAIATKIGLHKQAIHESTPFLQQGVSVDNVLELIDKKKRLEQQAKNMTDSLDGIDRMDSKIETLTDNIDGLAFELAERMPDVCPLCGRS